MKKSLLCGSIVVLLVFSLLAGCSAGASPSISIENAYGHPSAAVAGAGGLFMVIKNSGAAADKLVSGKSDACGMVEIHEMVKKDDGTMGMNMVANPVEVPAGGQLELKDGGMHIMCMKVDQTLFSIGSKINLVLTFEKSGQKTVSVEIRDK
jgi:copper(I)-binding protein